MLCALTLYPALSTFNCEPRHGPWSTMKLWMMLLLLQLHLGNAPWMKEVSVSLPAPSNVSISSFNMEHILSFLPGPGTPSDARFTVQFLRLRKSQWKPLAACAKLTAGQKCNLTRAFKDHFEHYQARVQAFTLTQTSNWTVLGGFQPLTDTVLGPVDVSLSGCGNCLLLRLRFPTAMEVGLIYRQMVLKMRRTRDDVQFSLSLPYKEETVIPYLQPGVEYCVTVSISSLFTIKTVFSGPHCAFTSSPPSRSSHVLMLGLLAAVCALGLLLMVLHFYGLQRLEVLRKCLSTTVSYILLQCQRGRGAPIELSGQMSAVQRLKEGSADCLLTAHRPLRSASEGGEEIH
ncbi:interferon alpha/beta receptor 2-like isoform X2 [Eleginops maclovinus]|uniref:interferon alpha/beta receptor 2-like isoform X2 n=1 Tax=Eleginops maclovinus TaxID=56733 RepID=UPI0030808979